MMAPRLVAPLLLLALAPAVALAQEAPPAAEQPVMKVEPPAAADATPEPVPPPAAPKGCLRGSDCPTGVCANNVCVAPSCGDGIKNQDEPAVDCGGGCAKKCDAGAACGADADCASGLCHYGVCTARGTSRDARRNGTETGVDCGGDAAPPCALGEGCFKAKDCASGNCVNNVCRAAASCSDGVKGEGESDVDCGGGCASCAAGRTCAENGDCVSGDCSWGRCRGRVAEQCADGVKNGLETDVDCGGGSQPSGILGDSTSCRACAAGKQCGWNSDCLTGYCSDGTCKENPRFNHPSSFYDTRMSFSLVWENVLAKPGETNPNIPGLRIGRPNQFGVLFFENYDTRFTGYENLTHFVLHKNVAKGPFLGEASFAIRMLQFTDVNLSALDDSSYIRLVYFTNGREAKGANVSLVAFPLSSDRLRLGYSYRLSWGGNPIFFKFNPDLPSSSTPPVNPYPAPGARLQYTNDWLTLWFGFKTSVLLNKNPTVADLEAIYGFLGGVGIDAVKDHLRLEVNGGHFMRGNNPNFYPTDQIGPGTNRTYPDFPVTTSGASFQVSLWSGLPPSLSPDYRLYRNDPTTSARFFGKPYYRPGWIWLLQSEVTVNTTTVQDFENPSATTNQVAYAADLNFRAQYGRTRFKLDAAVRSLEFILMNQPSFIPYTSLPRDAGIAPDFFASIGFDHYFQKDSRAGRIGYTVGPTVGLFIPSWFKPAKPLPQLCGNVGGSLCEPQTVVVRGEGDFWILPVKDAKGNTATVLPEFALKLYNKLDFLEYFSALLDVYYSYNPNQTRLEKAPDGSSVRNFLSPNVIGFNLAVQALF